MDAFASKKAELQEKRDTLITASRLLHRDFEEIQARQFRILLQAWICRNQILSKGHWSEEYFERVRELNSKLERKGVSLQDVGAIFTTVMEPTGYTSDFSLAGVIAHYLMFDWDHAVYNYYVMKVLSVLLMDLMDVDSLEEIIKSRRFERKLVFGEMKGLICEEYHEVKTIELRLDAQPLLLEEQLEIEVEDIPWIELFEEFQEDIADNHMSLLELDREMYDYVNYES
jgi:hypothetical protein